MRTTAITTRTGTLKSVPRSDVPRNERRGTRTQQRQVAARLSQEANR